MNGSTDVRLAGEFFILARNDVDRRPYLGSAAEATGLAAALLGELLIARLVGVHEGCVYPIPNALGDRREHERQRLQQDRPIRTAMQIISGQRQAPPVTALVEYLAGTVQPLIVEWLLVNRQIAARRRGLLGSRYVPVDQFVGSRPQSQLWSTMTYDGYYRAMAPTDTARLLGGLALHAGLAPRITALAAGAEVEAGLRQLVTQLPPDLRTLIDSFEQAVHRLATRR